MRRTVKVVPRLVEQRAAPAVKACREEASLKDFNAKDRANGAAIPVIATPEESNRFAFSDLKDVARPPVTWSVGMLSRPHDRDCVTFVDYQNKSDVS